MNAPQPPPNQPYYPQPPNQPYYPQPPQVPYPPGYQPFPSGPKMNGLAITGFILGLVCSPFILLFSVQAVRTLSFGAYIIVPRLILIGDLLLGFIPATLAIVFSAIGFGQSRQANGKFTASSKVMSLWGLGLGIVTLAVPFVVFILITIKGNN